MYKVDFEGLRNSPIKTTISNYTRADVGFDADHNGYYCKLRRDLELWCFIESQRSKFNSIKLWDFAKQWAWAIGPRVYFTKDGEVEIVGERFHEEDHINFAMTMFNFYREYAETV